MMLAQWEIDRERSLVREEAATARGRRAEQERVWRLRRDDERMCIYIRLADPFQRVP